MPVLLLLLESQSHSHFDPVLIENAEMLPGGKIVKRFLIVCDAKGKHGGVQEKFVVLDEGHCHSLGTFFLNAEAS